MEDTRAEGVENGLRTVESVFAELDSDRNGYINFLELVDASSHEEGRKLSTAGMLAHIKDLQTLSNDEFGVDNDGISVADLQRFEQMSQEIQMSAYISDIGINFFDVLDTSKDGFVTVDDLEAAKEKAPKSQKQIYDLLITNLSDVMEAGDDEVGWENSGATKNDFWRYHQEVASRNQVIEDVSLTADVRTTQLGTIVWATLRQAAVEMDKDKNNEITAQELKSYASSLPSQSQFAPGLSFARENFASIASLDRDDQSANTISAGDLRAYAALFSTNGIENLARDTMERRANAAAMLGGMLGGAGGYIYGCLTNTPTGKAVAIGGTLGESTYASYKGWQHYREAHNYYQAKRFQAYALLGDK